METTPLTTIILTGGRSRRMGRDKATLPYDGSTLGLRLAERFSSHGGAVFFSAAAESEAFAPWPQLCDRFPGAGPLNGLVSGFEQTAAQALFLTAVDLPNGDPALAARLAELRGEADACVILRKDGKHESTFAVYSRRCLEPALACLEQGKRSFADLFERIKPRWITEQVLLDFDLEHVLFNMNTPEDYETIMQKSSF